MWRAVSPEGSLTYTFIETVAAIRVYDIIRAVGGAVFISGLLVMLYNVFRTVAQGSVRIPSPGPSPAAVPAAGGR
jgi:cytochrome c oxidase cbb3-type subunit 1